MHKTQEQFYASPSLDIKKAPGGPGLCKLKQGRFKR